MTTLAKTQCQEFFVLQNFADAIEVSLPSERDNTTEEAQLEEWRERMQQVGSRDLKQGRQGWVVLEAIHELATEKYRASFRWPKGDIFVAATSVLAKEKVAETVGKMLAAHDARRYMGTMASIRPKVTHATSTFDPALVTIRRHWRSVTQLTTSIAYDWQDSATSGSAPNCMCWATMCPTPSVRMSVAPSDTLFL